MLVPQIGAGWAGWCVITTKGGAGGCPPGRGRPPVFAESWGSGGPPAVTVGYALTSSLVRFVKFDGGQNIPTQPDPVLLNRLRSVVVEIRGKELLSEDEAPPRFVPLDGKGRLIQQTDKQASSVGVRVPTQPTWKATRRGHLACKIIAAPMAGLVAVGGSVVSVVRRHGGLIGQGFLSCASESYMLHGWPLLAGILLNAGRPGTPPPPMMDMRALPGHPGIFQAPGPERSGADGALLSKRVVGGWLVTARAKLGQRLALLEHLRADVRVNTK